MVIAQGADKGAECQQREDGNEAVEQGNAEILHGDGGQIGEHHGQHQFAGFQFSDLAFAHDPQTDHNQDVENYGA